MKKASLFFALCAMLTVAAHAQDFKKFKVGLGSGYAMPSGKGAKSGVLLFLEPAYRIQDNLQVGLRMEIAVMARGFSEELNSGGEFDVSAAGSYTLNGQYYFNNNNFRPFVGLGFGLYSIKGASVQIEGGSGSTDLPAIQDESKFGFYPRVGFDAGHFVLTLDYNMVGATKVEDIEMKNSYFAIRFGVNIGGGRN